MAEEAASKEGASEAANTPSVQLLTCYIKDVSFENIGVQNEYIAKSHPQFEVGLNINNKKATGDGEIYEVSMQVNVKAEEGGQVIFILELDYAGRFRLRDVEESQRVPFLYIECPRLLFPYARRVVSSLTVDGGLLPLNLDHVDFVKLFHDSIKKAQAANEAKGGAKNSGKAPN